MSDPSRSYVPAAGVDWLLPFYDATIGLMGGRWFRRECIEAAAISQGQRVLDLGCGTGSLAVLIGQTVADVEVAGIDPDSKALAIARNKADRAGVEVAFEQGFADALPFPADHFDCVVSSLVFHHLPPDVVRRTVPEIARVLRPGGSVHVFDFGAAGHGLHGLLAHFLSHQHGDEDVAGELASLMDRAGLERARTSPARRTIFGRLLHTRASAPNPGRGNP